MIISDCVFLWQSFGFCLRFFVIVNTFALIIILFPCIDSNELGMDRKVFESDSYQRVFQYLQCHTCGKNLDNFLSQGIEESPLEFLKYILRFVVKIS